MKVVNKVTLAGAVTMTGARGALAKMRKKMLGLSDENDYVFVTG